MHTAIQHPRDFEEYERLQVRIAG